MYRYHPQTRKLRELVREGAIGDLRLVRGVFTTTLTAQRDIRLEPDLGGGCLWDLGSYPVSFALAIVGEKPVQVAGWRVLGDSGVDLTFMGQMRFATGTLAQFGCSFQSAPHWEADLVGSRGTIHLDYPWTHEKDETTHVRILRAKGTGDATYGDSQAHLERDVLTYEQINAYQCEVDAMVASILDGDQPVVSLADSRRYVATIVALHKSAREGRMVTL
jgi:predicted dehydrogenase